MSYTIQFVIPRKSMDLLRFFAGEAAKMLPQVRPISVANEIKVRSKIRTSKTLINQRSSTLNFLRTFAASAAVKKVKSYEPGTRVYELQKAYVSSGDLNRLSEETTSSRRGQPQIRSIRVEDEFGNVDVIVAGARSNPETAYYAQRVSL